MKINSIIFLCVVLTICGCGSSSSKSNEKDKVTGIYHYNITIAPDLSNRVNMKIHPKPIEDHKIISLTLDLVEKILHAGHRDTDQKDSYSVSFINQGLIHEYDVDQNKLRIDFSEFKTQSKRMDFIKERHDYADCGLKNNVDNFKGECGNLYDKAIRRPFGADLWSFFQNTIDDTTVKSADSPFDYADQKFQNRFRNVLVLLTDGYIECGLSEEGALGLSKNQSYDLGQSRIKKFRNAFKSSGMTDMKAFFDKNNYGIVPVKNKYVEDLHVLVLEMYDRSLTLSGNATIHPTDADIMELFWTDWLTHSKVKNFELHRCFPNERKAKQIVKKFILSE